MQTKAMRFAIEKNVIIDDKQLEHILKFFGGIVT